MAYKATHPSQPGWVDPPKNPGESGEDYRARIAVIHGTHNPGTDPNATLPDKDAEEAAKRHRVFPGDDNVKSDE